jgi:adenylate cyclase
MPAVDTFGSFAAIVVAVRLAGNQRLRDAARVPIVRCKPQEALVEVPEGTLLVDAIRAAGLPIATACGDELVCGRCGVRILRGRVPREKPAEREAKRRNRVPADLRLACVIRVRGDLDVSTDYWGSE